MPLSLSLCITLNLALKDVFGMTKCGCSLFPVYMSEDSSFSSPHFSQRFANLLGTKITWHFCVVTLILLLYTKLLDCCHFCHLPWISSIHYLSGKHIPLFLVAVLFLFFFFLALCLASGSHARHITPETLIISQQCYAETLFGFIPCSLRSTGKCSFNYNNRSFLLYM